MKKDLHLCPKVKCPMNILVILRNIYSNPDLFDDEQYLCKRFSHYAFSDDQPTVIVVKDTGITEPRQNLLQSCVKVAELSASAPVNTAKKCPGNHAAPGETVFVRKIIHENVSNDIKDAPLIFAGGRGLMNEQSFEALRRLADFFDASVGASRPVVDCGWAGPSEQIGQTGSFVHPKVYLRLSGCLQSYPASGRHEKQSMYHCSKHQPEFANLSVL